MSETERQPRATNYGEGDIADSARQAARRKATVIARTVKRAFGLQELPAAPLGPASSYAGAMESKSAAVATSLDILACFRLILGRDPNPEEMAGHFARVGEDLEGVVRSYVQSREFANRKLLEPQVPEDIRLADYGEFGIYASASDNAVGVHVLAQCYEPDVQALFRRFLKPGMFAFDVGANIGFFTMLAASIVGPGGGVLAVEPNPLNVRLIEASRRANGFGHVQVAFAAAGRKTDVLALNTAYSNGTASVVSGGIGDIMQAQIVPCFPLSQLAPPGRRVDFIKIDVEGAEGAVLAGARGILERDRPIIISEFSPPQLQGLSDMSGEDYLTFLQFLGYRLAVIRGFEEPEEGDVESVMRAFRNANRDHIDILAVPSR